MKSFSSNCFPHFRQWLAASQVHVIMLVSGMSIGWMCPFIGSLIEKNPPFIATQDQISWIASLIHLLRPVGNLLGAICNHYLGSKMTLHLTLTILFSMSAVTLVFATSIKDVYITQIFTGIGTGTVYSIFPLYIAEIGSANIRGALSSMVMQGYSIGIVAGNLLGEFLEPWIYALINLTVVVFYMVCFFFIPETPYRYILKNKPVQAIQSLQWYQEKVDANEEIDKLKNFLDAKPELQIARQIKELLICPVNRKVMLILLVTYGLCQFSGTFTILEFSDIIFMHGNVNLLKPATLVTIMGVIGIIGSWVAIYTSDRFGRTVMLFFSCTMYAIASALIGVNFHLLDLGYNSPYLQCITIIAALLFRFSISLGVIGVPMILVSELFAPNVKNLGTFTCHLFSALCAFISNKFFQDMVDCMTYKYVFYLYAVLTLSFGIYSIVCIPETKGKTLEEIQYMLVESVQKNKKNSKTSDITQF